MNALNRQLKAVKEAHAAAVKATEAWNAYLSLSNDASPDRTQTAKNALLAISQIASATERELLGRIGERNRMFDAATILQAVIRWNGLERKIVVAKPNFRIDEPFIPDGFYRAIREKWQVPEKDAIFTTEQYNIVVVDKNWKIITTINTKI